jgi:hypothetical protein
MTVNGTLDDRYLTWLHRQLEPDTLRNPARSHWKLFIQLHGTEFTWFIPNDDNRLFDGLDIRAEYVDAEEGGDVPGHWLSQACSFLEMLVALSRRMAFETEREPDFWFWQMIENLNLRIYTDEVYDSEVESLVDDIITGVIQRTFRADGSDGLFPLRHPGTDQREVEIWYQMSQYLMENIVV